MNETLQAYQAKMLTYNRLTAELEALTTAASFREARGEDASRLHEQAASVARDASIELAGAEEIMADINASDLRFIVFDLETTGNNTDSDRIVEFSFIELNGDLEEVGRWTKRVNPGMPITPEAAAVHGIRDEDVADLPGFEKHAKRVQAIIKDAILCGQYATGFDIPILHNELLRCGEKGIDLDHPVVDTLATERAVLPHNLKAMYQRYTGKELEGWHGAEADTAACAEVLQAQRREHFAREHPAKMLVPVVGAATERPLDRAGKLVENSDGVACYAFGQHRGKPVTTDLGYLDWMINKADFPRDTKMAGRRILANLG